jgi:hypothetical protein
VLAAVDRGFCQLGELVRVIPAGHASHSSSARPKIAGDRRSAARSGDPSGLRSRRSHRHNRGSDPGRSRAQKFVSYDSGTSGCRQYLHDRAARDGAHSVWEDGRDLVQ